MEKNKHSFIGVITAASNRFLPFYEKKKESCESSGTIFTKTLRGSIAGILHAHSSLLKYNDFRRQQYEKGIRFSVTSIVGIFSAFYESQGKSGTLYIYGNIFVLSPWSFAGRISLGLKYCNF